MRRPAVWAWAGAAVALGLALLLFDPRLFTGGDNAAYYALAEALATGRGYVDLIAPGHPPHAVYPPGYPAFLVPFYWIFSGSIVGVKVASMVAAAVALWTLWRVAGRDASVPAWAAAAAVGLVGLYPVFLDYSHWVLSEMTYLAVTLLAIAAFLRSEGYLADGEEGGAHEGAGAKTGDADDRGGSWVVGLALALASFLVRTAGLTLLLAALAHALLHRRWRRAGMAAAFAAVGVAPWLAWTSAHAPATGSYFDQLLASNRQDPLSPPISIGEFVLRGWDNLLHYATTELPRLFWAGDGVPSLVVVATLFLAGPLLVWGVIRALRTRGVEVWDLHVVLSLGVLAAWPWTGDRFFLTIAPFVWLYVLIGLDAASRLWARSATAAVAVCAALSPRGRRRPRRARPAGGHPGPHRGGGVGRIPHLLGRLLRSLRVDRKERSGRGDRGPQAHLRLVLERSPGLRPPLPPPAPADVGAAAREGGHPRAVRQPRRGPALPPTRAGPPPRGDRGRPRRASPQRVRAPHRPADGRRVRRAVRILHVATAWPREPGDVITPWLVTLLERQHRRGHEVEVLASSWRGIGDQSWDGIPVHRFRYAPARRERLTHEEAAADRVDRDPAMALWVPAYVAGGMLRGWRLGRRRDYDVVHVHWVVPHGPIGWAAARGASDATLVTTFYAAEIRFAERRFPLAKRFLSWWCGRSRLIAISESTRRLVRPYAGEAPIEVIPYGMPLADTGGTAPPIGAEPVVLFVGRLVARKGVDRLIEALATIRDRPWRLEIVGFGPERERLETLAAERGLADRVALLGRISDQALVEAYQRAAVFVLPATLDERADTEGLGVVLLEAMAQETPVVATRRGGIVDIVVDGETGLLVDDEVEALARGVERMLADPAAAREMGRRGAERVRRSFAWDTILDRIDAVYGTAP